MLVRISLLSTSSILVLVRILYKGVRRQHKGVRRQLLDYEENQIAITYRKESHSP